MAIETALERYELGTDPEVTVRAWPEIQAVEKRPGVLARRLDFIDTRRRRYGCHETPSGQRGAAWVIMTSWSWLWSNW